MHRILFNILFAAALFSPLRASAAAVPAIIENSSAFNPVLLALLSLIAVLVFANGLLANVLKQLAFALRDKSRKERINTVVKTLLLASLFFIPSLTLRAQEVSDPIVEVPVSPYISGIPRADFYLLIGVIGFLMLLMVIFILLISMLTNELRNVPQKAHIPKLVFQRNLLDVFNKSVAVDKEAAIILDHDYDGIRELDNDLPPWWKYGFVLTIIAACIYLGYYHAAGGPSQADEYRIAVAKGEEEKAAYLAKASSNVDENSVTMVLDAGELAAAGNIFQSTCAACHAKDGGGGVGPNLTDDYWLHGGSIKEVFKSVKYGWPDKGMKSWKDDYSPKQIAALASYVKSLKGSKPLVAKAPQGDLFVEGGDRSIDSISNKTEPTLEPTGKKENKDNPIGPYPVKNK